MEYRGILSSRKKNPEKVTVIIIFFSFELMSLDLSEFDEIV